MSLIVECNCLSPVMLSSYGETVHLALSVARRMERVGDVKIKNHVTDDTQLRAVKAVEYLTRDTWDGARQLTKVAWIQDYHKNGGAELSCQTVVGIGALCGFDIVGVTPSNFNAQIIASADIVVLNNWFEFDPQQENEIKTLLWGAGKKPYIKYEHDHREIWLRMPIAQRVFSEARHTFFISPAHSDNHIKALGAILPSEKVTILPLAVNVERFKPVDAVERKPHTVLVPSYGKCKENVDAFIAQHAEYTYTIPGYSDLAGRTNVRVIEELDADGMVPLYASHEFVLHLPQKPGSGERVVFEAVLCGCKPITNDGCSHTTWKTEFDWEDSAVLRERLRDAPYAFWAKVWGILHPTGLTSILGST